MRKFFVIFYILIVLFGCYGCSKKKTDYVSSRIPLLPVSSISEETNIPTKDETVIEAMATEPLATTPVDTITSQENNTEEKTEALESKYHAFQHGDTTPTWDKARINAFPTDEDCSDGLLLEKWLAVEGLTLQDLEDRKCSQLLLTAAGTSDGVETTNVCYEKQEDGNWQSVPGLSRLPGHVGKNGIKHSRIIDSYTSPAGLWALGMAFGNSAKPEGLKLPWRDVTPESDWISDTESKYFNTWQERDDPTLDESWDYSAGEHLADYPQSYAYSCVIEFNTKYDVVPSRGCAIFLHCGDDYTAGCVSLPEEYLLRILLWLDPDKNPYILITGNQS